MPHAPRLAALALVLAAAGPASANDSSVGLAVGGLEFRTEDRIAVVSEDLYLSPDAVRVTYVMRNLTDAPVTIDIGFPLPPVGRSGDIFNVDFPVRDSADFVGFTTVIDGTRVPLTPHLRAMVAGRDHAAALTDLGVPLIPLSPELDAALGALDPADLARLQTAGALDGRAPLWQLQATFLRRQTLPPGRDVTVEHSYTPAIATSLDPPLFPGVDASASDWLADYGARFCWDDAMAARQDRLARGIPDRDGAVTYFSEEIAYVLSTGANWAGPIGEFTLTVEGRRDLDMVSLCLDGVTWPEQSRATFHATDFTPRHDLAVYVYRSVIAGDFGQP